MTQTLFEFLDDLASSKPAPGGGGAAALLGGIASALENMVANLTTGKKKYAEYQEEIESILDILPKKRLEILSYIKKDEEAFLPLSAAYSIPKEDPGRDAVMEKALKDACMAPLGIVKEVYGVVPYLERLEIIGSKLAISDVACAAAACKASLEAALVNVYINTKLMKDREALEKFNNEAEELVFDGVKRCEAVYDRIQRNLKKHEEDDSKLLLGKAVADSIIASLNEIIDNELSGSKENIDNDLSGVKENKDSLNCENLKNKLPKLAIVRCGAKEDDLSYERGVKKRMEGFKSELLIKELPEDIEEKLFLKEVKALNDDADIDGILIFRPLPKQIDEEKVGEVLSPQKDLDCMTERAYGRLLMGKEGFYPCTALAVMKMLEHYKIDLKGKNVTIVGRSLVIGKPLALLMTSKNATVTLCHTKTKDIKEKCRKADIIVAACGVAKMIDESYVSENQIIIDVGINVLDGKLCGDVDFDKVALYAKYITPVPRGVGSVTTSVLSESLVKAWINNKKQINK